MTDRHSELLQLGLDDLAVADDDDRHLRRVEVFVGDAIYVIDRHRVDLRDVIVEVRIGQTVCHERSELIRDAASRLERLGNRRMNDCLFTSSSCGVTGRLPRMPFSSLINS